MLTLGANVSEQQLIQASWEDFDAGSKWASWQLVAMAIGFVVVAGAYRTGAVFGGCFNPALAIGVDISSVLKCFGGCLIYVVCELIGAVLSAILCKIVPPEDFSSGGVANCLV
jgi:glycerol uptake facilitator-like aquaporin